MKKVFLSALALACVGATPVLAADLPAKAPPVAVVAPYNWAGFYIGGNIGYGWGANSDPSVSFTDGSAIGIAGYFAAGGNVTPNMKPSGMLGGLQMGYNVMFGPTFVAGIVADFQWSDLKDSATNSVTPTGFVLTNQSQSLDLNWFGTVRGKLGVAANNWLFYGTGGLAYGHVKNTASFVVPPGAVLAYSGSTETTKTGWALGAGIDWGITRNWTLGSEYLYVDLGDVSTTMSSTTGIATATTLTVTNKVQAHIWRATLNYKF